MTMIGRRNASILASVLVALSVLVASHVILLLLHSTSVRHRSNGAAASPRHQEHSFAERVVNAVDTDTILEETRTEANAAIVPTVGHGLKSDEPFTSPLYGYSSRDEMNDRSNRFPSIQERVQVYMSNWYLPPCDVVRTLENEVNGVTDGFVHYRLVPSKTGSNDESNDHLLIREIETLDSVKEERLLRSFWLDSDPTLGKLHVLTRDQMQHDRCGKEYCSDMLKHWYPSVDRIYGSNTTPPVLFQFSDEELSRALSVEDHELRNYPNLPHLKKSRLSLLPQDLVPLKTCEPSPKSLLPTVAQDEKVTAHLHPIIYKLKTNRHYGMIESIPSQDMPWSGKKDQAIFRGTLTGMLPSGSRFSLAVRDSHPSKLVDSEAEEKCMELDRCRLVYEVNRFYTSQSITTTPMLVDAKLVLPQLQHADIPEEIHNVSIFGSRMSKEDLMGYKAIVLLEGNDAGTGFKWGLFSNSVVMSTSPLNFTSWAMEELLEPWLHYIPLDRNNYAEDIHKKMQWVLDHDQEAEEIARRGSLWIRDLLLHPDAIRDDEEISDDMVRRYMAHFVHDEGL